MSCQNVVSQDEETEIFCDSDLTNFNIEIYKGSPCIFVVDLSNTSCDFDPDNSVLTLYVRRTNSSSTLLMLDSNIGNGIRYLGNSRFEITFITEQTRKIPSMDYIFSIVMEQEGVFLDDFRVVAYGDFIVHPSMS